MNVKEIETAISQLPPSQVAQLAEWFAEFQAGVWDEQIERDVASGRIESLIDEAERDFASGQCDVL